MGYPPEAFEYPLDPPGYVVHAPFSWTLFLGACLAFGALLSPVALGLVRAFRQPALGRHASWPPWTPVAVVALAVAWWLSWTDWGPVQFLRPYSFTPLWVAFIACISAMTIRRGHPPLWQQPRAFDVIVISAVFWWIFEYLNRFTENWVYTGAPLEGPLSYILQGTLPFAVVLPGVASVQAWLATSRRLDRAFIGFGRPFHISPSARPVYGGLLIAVSCASLAALSVWPNLLFCMLWLAPLGIFLGLPIARGRSHALSAVGRGDWRAIVTWGLAGVICGFFWELWNMYSLARWTYFIPYVGEPKIFEMPLLGYLGYIPFGLQCAMIADLVGYPTGPRPTQRQ